MEDARQMTYNSKIIQEWFLYSSIKEIERDLLYDLKHAMIKYVNPC